MRRLLWELSLLAYVLLWLSCLPPRVGQPIVGTRDCRDPQVGYAREGLPALDPLGITGTQDVELSCDDFVSACMDRRVENACGPQAAYFVLGTDVIHVDPARANGLFAFQGVVNHELVHWYIAHGPHPERAVLHVCPCGDHAPTCWTGGCADRALMAPAQTGLGPVTGAEWTGATESVDPGALTQNTPLAIDVRFVRWAVTP